MIRYMVTGFFLFAANVLENIVRKKEPTTFPKVGALSVADIIEKKIQPIAPDKPQYINSDFGAVNTMAKANVATIATINCIR